VNKSIERWGAYAPIFFFIVVVLLPFSLLISRFIKDPSSIISAFDPHHLRILRFTFVQATISAVLAVLAGFPGAYVFSKTNVPLRSFLKAITLIPFVIPGIVMAMGMLNIFGRRGLVNDILVLLGGTRKSLLYTFGAIIVAHVVYNFPLTIRVVGDAWSKISDDLISAARVDGASRIKIFARIELPLLLPATVLAFILAFMYCFTSFAVVLILGGVRYSTLEVIIYSNLKVRLNFPVALSLTIVQSVILGALSLLVFTLRKRYVIDMWEPIARKEKFPRWCIAYLAIAVIVAFAPIFSSIVYGFVGYGGGFTLENFRRFSHMNVEMFTGANVATIVFYSCLFPLVATVLALFVSYHGARSDLPINRFFTVSAAGVSPVTLSYGYMTLGNCLGVSMNHTYFFIPLVYSALIFPLVYTLMVGAWDTFPMEILEMAELDGVKRWKRFVYVIFPMMKSEIFGSFTLAFVLVLGEMAATMTLQSPGFATFSLLIYRLYSSRHMLEARAANAILALIVICLFVLGEKLGSSRET